MSAHPSVEGAKAAAVDGVAVASSRAADGARAAMAVDAAVRMPNGKFEPREVRLLKRSESTMVLSGGVKPNDVVAMMDPTADKSGKKNKNQKESSGTANPMGGMPGGK